jgi:hypothetical protein
MIFNTCWRIQLENLLAEDKNTEKNESGFDYIVEKTVILKTHVEKKGMYCGG